MKIKVNGIVDRILYATNSRTNDEILDVLGEYQLPNTLDLYIDYKFIFPCFHCGKEIIGGYYDRKWHYIARYDLSLDNYGVTDIIDDLAKVFDLKLISKLGGIYYYNLNNHPCGITYDRCPHCHSQFMLCKYGNGAGDRGRVGYLYMAPIKFITCDESELLQWAAKSKLDNRPINPDYSGPLKSAPRDSPHSGFEA